MKYLLLASLLSLSVLQANEDQKSVRQAVVDQPMKSGIEQVEEVTKNYTSGQYQKFLSQVDSAYEKDRKEWRFDRLLDTRKEISSLPEKHPQQAAAYLDEAKKLKEERDQKLVEVCLENPNYLSSASIKNMVFFSPSQEQKEALNYLYDLKFKFKGDGKSPLENELIRLDIEYWLKSLSLDVQGLEESVDKNALQEKHLVLELEKLEKMKEAALKEPKSPIANHILVAYGIFPKQKAALIEEERLYRLAKGEIAPQNPLEEKA